MPATENETVLRMSHRFSAPPERVFDAWTNPELLRRWWAAGPDWEGAEAEVDLRPGGSLYLSMHDPDGTLHAGRGEFTEVERPGRLAYKWQWVTEGELAESLVEVEFRPDGDGTELILTHSGLADRAMRDAHDDGWRKCFDNLERRVLAAA